MKAEVRAQLEADDNGIEGLKSQVELQLASLQLAENQRKQEETASEAERTRLRGENSVLRSVQNLTEISDINDRLREVRAAQPGIGFESIRRAAAGPIVAFANLLGIDEADARQVASDIQRLDQLTNREGLEQLFSGLVNAGTLTNDKVARFLETKPSFENLPEVNDKIVADMLQDVLAAAGEMEVSLDNRELVESRIQRLRGGESGSNSGFKVLSVE